MIATTRVVVGPAAEVSVPGRWEGGNSASAPASCISRARWGSWDKFTLWTCRRRETTYKTKLVTNPAPAAASVSCGIESGAEFESGPLGENDLIMF